MSTQRVVLVTGVSSGIGKSIAQFLAERGLRVFGTSRNPSRVETMPGLEVLPLDVRFDESVTACVDVVLKQAGRLDILVNNAGYGLRGAIEEISMEEAQGQFETNFWGAVRMVRAVLPVMRGQGSGQIINICSVAGVVALPFAGFYSPSKFALEGYTEALRHEASPFNIRVSLVEPYYIKTQLLSNTETAVNLLQDYAPWRERAYAAVTQEFERGDEPTVVARCVLHIVDDKTPRLRYQAARSAGSLVLLRRLLPYSMVERMVRRRLHLDVKK